MHGCARGPPPEGRWGGRSNPPLYRWYNMNDKANLAKWEKLTGYRHVNYLCAQCGIFNNLRDIIQNTRIMVNMLLLHIRELG